MPYEEYIKGVYLQSVLTQMTLGVQFLFWITADWVKSDSSLSATSQWGTEV